LEEGCQSEFGKCKSNAPVEDDKVEASADKEVNETPEDEEESEDDEEGQDNRYRCGEGIGKCRKGECCSQWGWCGRSDKHCLIEEGCQSEFGKCKTNVEKATTTIVKTVTKTKEQSPTVIYGKCGEGYGSCKEGYCCSKWGWCGKTDAYCSKEKGCQSEFGICSDTSVRKQVSRPKKPKYHPWQCGEGIGKCKEGYCCSKWGWCGKSSAYCNEGCQSEFGECW